MFFNDLIFIFILTIYLYFQNKFLLRVAKKSKFIVLTDSDFDKPQAFHSEYILRLGGTAIFFSLNIVFLYLFYFKNIFIIEYISFSAIFFMLGIFDDSKIKIAPKFRLIMMIVFLITLVISCDLYIEKSGIESLNNLLEIDIFALPFICLCFLFIINGSNLIDGFNGLLGIHSLIIFIILFIINFTNGNTDLMYILLYISIVILVFLKFNFPHAKMFLGDSGAYIIGSLIAVSAIKTSIINPSISPFFFCILLFYLFTEVFFSFFRKILIARQSPLLPDNKHLHMILYKFFLKNKKTKLESNYSVSIYINLIYLILILPGVFFMEYGLFCRYYFFSLLIIYPIFYKVIDKKIR